MPKLYLRRVMTTDPYGNLRRRDITGHFHPQDPEQVRWVWHREDKPKRGCKRLTLNGVTYEVEWI